MFDASLKLVARGDSISVQRADRSFFAQASWLRGDKPNVADSCRD